MPRTRKTGKRDSPITASGNRNDQQSHDQRELHSAVSNSQLAARVVMFTAFWEGPMNRLQKLSAALVLVSASAFLSAAVPATAKDGNGDNGHGNGPTVNTTDGPVRGSEKNGVNIFLGIPYAAPPVDKFRWMPPQSPDHHDLLDATQYANTCPQVTELGAFAGPSSTSEDCLYLNVFTTGKSAGPRGGLKPVI